MAGPAVQVPCSGVLESTVAPAGNVAASETFVSVTALVFVTVNVWRTLFPAVTVGGSLDSVTVGPPGVHRGPRLRRGGERLARRGVGLLVARGDRVVTGVAAGVGERRLTPPRSWFRCRSSGSRRRP